MKKLIILSLLLFSITVYAHGDVLYLKNGTQYIGTTVRQDDEQIIFRIGEGDDTVEATFFSEEVLRIDKPGLSNFITLPSDKGPSIEIPRPVIAQEPVVAEQVKAQRTKMTEESVDIAEEADMLKEGSAQAEALGSIEKVLEEKEESPPEPPAPSFEGHVITEELSKLLDEEEKAYFLDINAVVKDITAKMANLIADPNALAGKDENEVQAVVQHMPAEVDSIIAKFKDLKAPELFIAFHNKYLENLALMKDVFSSIADGSVEGAQNKIVELQIVAKQMQDELIKILDIKRRGGSVI